MIRVITGAMGGGKTYYAVWEILRVLATSKRTVCSNIAFGPEFVEKCKGRFMPLDDGQVPEFWKHTPKGALIVVDEGHVHFDSRNWSRTSKTEFSPYLTHIRKFGDEVWFITQEVGQIESRVRGLCCWFTVVMSFQNIWKVLRIDWPWLPRGFLIRDFNDQECETQVAWRYVRCVPKVFKWYDSWAVNTAAAVDRAKGFESSGDVVLF